MAFEKMVEIPTGPVSPQFIATEAIPTYNYTNQSQKSNTAVFHTPGTVLLESDVIKVKPC